MTHKNKFMQFFWETSSGVNAVPICAAGAAKVSVSPIVRPKTLHFLANPASIHVRQWVELLGLEYRIVIYCIGEEAGEWTTCSNTTVQAPLPEFLKVLPIAVRYCCLGVWLRFKAVKIPFLHVHNSSGYGLAALLSGRNFFLTTYGSEIFDSHRRGSLYRAVLSRVLASAKHVTSSAEAMKEYLVGDMGIPPGKISVFSLGVAKEFEGYKSDRHNRSINDPIWISNRRILPLYCIQEIVDAFKVYKKAGGRGRLLLLNGDASGDYSEGVYNSITQFGGDISLVREMVSREHVIKLLRSSTFCISLPYTDQLSSSILEGMSQGSIPILRPLRSYASILNCAIEVDDTGDLQSALLNIFQITARMSTDEILTYSERSINLVNSRFSRGSAASCYLQILGQMDSEID